LKQNVGEIHQGLEVARIFHGINSPKFPITVWGQNSFWGRYMYFPFKQLQELAQSIIDKDEEEDNDGNGDSSENEDPS
jgi:hypothetical protein